MKNFKFFKSGFCEKLKLLLIPIGLLIGSMTTQTWAWYYLNGSTNLTGNNWDWYNESCNMGGSNTITFMAKGADTYYFKLYKRASDSDKWDQPCGSLHSVTGTALDSYGTQSGTCAAMWVKTNEVANITFTLYGSDQLDVTVTKCAYYIKYPWNGGAFGWSGDMKSNGDGTYSVRGQYGGKSYNYGRKNSDGGADSGYKENAAIITDASEPNKGDYCIFTYDPSDHSLRIRKASSASPTNYFYFDNSNAQWSETYTYFAIGNPEYSTLYGSMNTVSNTKLKYGLSSENSWSDISYYAIVAGNSEWDGSHTWNYPSLTGWTKRSAPYLTKFDMRSGYIYLIGKANGTNDQPITLTEKGNTASSMNSTQTVKYALATNGTAAAAASVMTLGSTPATITIASYKFNDGTYSAVAASSSPAKSMPAGGTTYSNTETAGYTATTTITVSSINDNYRFKGFYTAAAGGTALTDGNGNANDYVFYPKAATTVFARFVSLYNVSYDINGGTGTLPTKGAGKSESGTNVVLGNNNNTSGNGNISKIGYRLTGWNTAVDGNGDHYDLGGTITAIASNTPLYAEWTPITFTIAFNANGGTGSMDNQEFTYDATENLTANAFTKAGFYFEGWAETADGEVVKRDQADGCTLSTTNGATKTLYAKWKAISSIATDCWDGNTYKCTEITNLATPKPALTATWSGATWGGTPSLTTDVVIPANMAMTVDANHALAKSILLGVNSSLSIEPNKGLEVAGTITKADGSAPTASDLVLGSSASGNATLIFDNSNNAAATVQMYSKASVDGDTWNWQYMAPAFTNANALYDYYGSYLYVWNDGGWNPVANGATLEPFAGYCITNKTANSTYVTDGTLVPTTSHSVTLGENVDMVIGNSWTAPIYIGGFTASTFTSIPATIYLFNTGSAENGSELYSGEGDPAGTYVTIPVNAAKYTGNELIAPLQAFFVTTVGVGGRAGTITMNYDELVRTTTHDHIINAGPMHAPKRVNEEEDPEVMKIWAIGAEYSDRLVILEREDFTTGFDNGWDGEKKSFSDVAPSVYVIAETEKDAVSAVPDYEGTILGFLAGIDTQCTMNFDYNGEENWYLNDLKEEKSTLITNENSYSFSCSSTDAETRFVISRTPIHKVPTGTENVSAGTNARKQMINGVLYVIRDGRIYNAEGSLVK